MVIILRNGCPIIGLKHSFCLPQGAVKQLYFHHTAANRLRKSLTILRFFKNMFILRHDTGSLWEEICNEEIVQYLDVCVDGEFQIDKRDTSLRWKGSSNQRVIDVPSTLREGKVVLHCDN